MYALVKFPLALASANVSLSEEERVGLKGLSSLGAWDDLILRINWKVQYCQENISEKNKK